MRRMRGESLHLDLTSRQIEVAKALADGLTYDAAGKRLSISAETIKYHSAAIRAAVGARTNAGAIAALIRLRLI